MEQKTSDLHTTLIKLATAAEPYSGKELRTYDDEKDIGRLLATAARYALDHPNTKLKNK